MFARLRGRFQSAKVDCGESGVRVKEGGLSTERNGGRRRWSWGMWSKSWALYVELSVRGGLELAFVAMGHKNWSLCKPMNFYDRHNS